jgi:hypothetical protein
MRTQFIADIVKVKVTILITTIVIAVTVTTPTIAITATTAIIRTIQTVVVVVVAADVLSIMLINKISFFNCLLMTPCYSNRIVAAKLLRFKVETITAAC